MSINISASKINIFQNNTNNPLSNLQKSNKSNDENDKNSHSFKLDQNKKQSSLMENLLKQKESLNSLKQSIVAKEMDATEKKYKLEDINTKIQEVEAQIQQLNIQEKQEKIEKEQEKLQKKKADEEKYNKNQDEVRDDIIISASLNELIKFNNSKGTIHLLKDSKNRQKVEAQYIKPNDIPNSYNNKRLAQISKSLSNIDMSVSKEIKDLNKSAKRIKDKTEVAVENLRYTEDLESEKKSKDNTANDKANEDDKDKKL